MKTLSSQDILARLKQSLRITSDTELANYLGISKTTLSNWKSRNSCDFGLVFTKCEHVNLDWLIYGKIEGKTKCSQNIDNGANSLITSNKYTKNYSIKKEKGEKFRHECNPVVKVAHLANQNDKEGIPLLPLSAMAGAFTADNTVMEYECERYVIPAFKGADFLMPVKGDSMQPTYYSGDLVACQRVPLADLFFQWNKTYVLDTDQGPLIKRIKHGHDEDHVLIVSDNKDYEPFELAMSQFHGVAIVKGLVRLE